MTRLKRDARKASQGKQIIFRVSVAVSYFAAHIPLTHIIFTHDWLIVLLLPDTTKYNWDYSGIFLMLNVLLQLISRLLSFRFSSHHSNLFPFSLNAVEGKKLWFSCYLKKKKLTCERVLKKKQQIFLLHHTFHFPSPFIRFSWFDDFTSRGFFWQISIVSL